MQWAVPWPLGADTDFGTGTIVSPGGGVYVVRLDPAGNTLSAGRGEVVLGPAP